MAAAPRNPDRTGTRFVRDVVGHKLDAAVEAVTTTASLMAYLKAVLNVLMGTAGLVAFPAAAKAANDVSLAEVLRYMQEKKLDANESVGDADIDISEADYTSYQALLTIAPAAGETLLDCKLRLFLEKATTGYDAVATAADVIDTLVQRKVDGTTWAADTASVQKTAGSLSDLGVLVFDLGMVGPTEEVRIAVKLNAERGDVEIPYTLTYRGADPTITAVAAA